MDEHVYSATGKRKSAIARVRMIPGDGKFEINKRALNEYFQNEISKMVIKQPIELTETSGKYDVFVNVKGGGISSQAGAIRHGIAKALLDMNTDFRNILKKAGLITRDSRTKERKKYGQRKARAKFQYSKR